MMDTTTTHEPAATLEHVPVELQDRIEDAAELVGGLYRTIDDAAMSPAVAQLWHAARLLAGEHALLEEQHTLPVRVAHVLALSALIRSPEAVMGALRQLRADLVRLDPDLAHIAN